jgi:hypothetical protein
MKRNAQRIAAGVMGSWITAIAIWSFPFGSSLK